MPVNKYALARYQIIDKILRKMNYVKTSYLVEVCRNELGYSISRRTIQLDLDTMKNDSFLGYFAPIEYCKKRKAYYYSHTNFILTTFQFSKKEIDALMMLYDYLKNEVDNEYLKIVNSCIYKMKQLLAS